MKQPLNLTLFIWQGQTFNDQLKLANEDGTPVDLTGYAAQMQARSDVTSLVPIFDWSTATGEIVLGGANGTVTFNLSSEATYLLPTGLDVQQWYYDLHLYTDDYAERPIEGVIVVYPAIPRPVIV